MTYSALGAVMGGLGSIPWLSSPWGLGLSALIITWFALSLGGWVKPVEARIPFLARGLRFGHRLGGPMGSLVVGFVTAWLPCGLVYAALSLPLVGQSAWQGALAMVLFGLGTTPLLTATSVGVQKGLRVHPWVRKGMAVAILAAGLYGLAQRHVPADDPDAVPACHEVEEVI